MLEYRFKSQGRIFKKVDVQEHFQKCKNINKFKRRKNS